MKKAGHWSYTSVDCATSGFTGTSLINIASHLPQIVMAYTFQFNFFSFYKSLQINPGENPDNKMLVITKRSIFSVCSIYLVVAILGYITFGCNVNVKIIDNFNHNKEEFGTAFLTIINISFMFLSGLGFPMLFFNCRNFIMSVAIDIMYCFKGRAKIG